MVLASKRNTGRLASPVSLVLMAALAAFPCCGCTIQSLVGLHYHEADSSGGSALADAAMKDTELSPATRPSPHEPRSRTAKEIADEVIEMYLGGQR